MGKNFIVYVAASSKAEALELADLIGVKTKKEAEKHLKIFKAVKERIDPTRQYKIFVIQL